MKCGNSEMHAVGIKWDRAFIWHLSLLSVSNNTQQQCYVYNSPSPHQPPRAHSFTTDRIDPQWMYRFVVATVAALMWHLHTATTARPTRLANPQDTPRTHIGLTLAADSKLQACRFAHRVMSAKGTQKCLIKGAEANWHVTIVDQSVVILIVNGNIFRPTLQWFLDQSFS